MPYRRKYVPKRKPRRAQYAKKIKRPRQAYKPRQKRQFQMKRMPFVETKKVTSTITHLNVANPQITPADITAPRYRQWTNQNISPTDGFMFLTRGNSYNHMTGRDIYSKYLKQKIEIQLPTGVPPDTTVPNGESNRPYSRITQPVQFWVVWGWIKKPFGNHNDESGSAIDGQDIIDEINYITANGDKLLGNINSRNTLDSDFLTFKDKRKNIWTMKKKLLKKSNSPVSVQVAEPFQEEAFRAAPETTAGEPQNPVKDFGDFQGARGYPNLLQTSIEWKINRKMRFYPDASGTGGFARDSWLPYSFIICPKQFQDGCNRSSPALYRYEGSDPTGTPSTLRQYYDLVGDIKISATMCHWFSDS